MKFGDLTLDLKTGKMKANQNEIAPMSTWQWGVGMIEYPLE